jgi:hypothetical protein
MIRMEVPGNGSFQNIYRRETVAAVVLTLQFLRMEASNIYYRETAAVVAITRHSSLEIGPWE